MTITSLNFFVFLGLTTIVYYLFPKKYRWISLLVFSLAFFSLASIEVAGYFVFGVATIYISSRLIGEKLTTQKAKKATIVIALAFNIAMLFLLKYINIIPNTINGFGELFNIDFHLGTINLIAPIGISYYTLSMISYLVDVYWTTIPAEKNFFKVMLFSCYYPCLISGPFIRYTQMKSEFFDNGDFEWDNIFKGFHRVVYGLLKKMVIADNLAIIVNAIFADTDVYSGPFIVIGVVFYALQIYCDFSGCMDIVIGASKLYGVKLPENFESPFFSKNLSEFWRRWHITLGSWGKDYIMYPLLKSEAFQKLNKKSKKKFGKKLGKKIPVFLAILILWVIIGIWHGASYKYIFAAGILPWIYLTSSELLEESFVKLRNKLKINVESKWFHIFQSLRTLFMMCIVWLFALAPSFTQSFALIADIFKFDPTVVDPFISEVIMGDHTLYAVLFKWAVIVVTMLGVAIVDYLKYNNVDVAEKFNSCNHIFRFALLIAMIGVTLMFGVYGPGFVPADFIYGGF
ncbi:MAG: MBOAT family protein [Ruminococcus sp.]|nr:MBOAT family protein [Ruminococcus sp.]